MRYIKSCGFIAFRQIEGSNYYLIIKSHNGDVGFPKGHMETGESEMETAIRELKEETGIEVKTISGFRRQIEYPLPRIPDAIKQTVYFLGKCTSQTIITQEAEVAEASFLSFDDAISVLTFEETKKMLKDAEQFIRLGSFSL
ncbi:MAG: NUDIX domain-containing protein [Clostridia bacterium]|nr:NUDIX domain-containing protein [Clostridia bacterium]